MKQSYLTDDERLRLSFEPWPDGAALGYADVSRTQLSIARHYGGIPVQGRHYVYFPESDELWRDDVLALVHKWRKDAARDVKPGHFPDVKKMVQTSLLDGG